MKMKTTIEAYHQAVRYLESLPAGSNTHTPRHGRLFAVPRMDQFLERLGNPERDVPFIHVGGTSGKGSTATMIQSILVASGYKTGLYTSPFTTTTIERFKLNTSLMSAAEFVALLNHLKPVIDWMSRHSRYGRPTYFEICTAIALSYFSQNDCDYAVIEVGMGGTNDATNCIPAPVATVINLIDYDHTDILGPTIMGITAEKAGIIKPGTTLFTTTKNRPRVIQFLRHVAQKKGVPMRVVTTPRKPAQLGLAGPHQQTNAALATAVGHFLGAAPMAIRSGLRTATMPCRFEQIQKKPVVILDGAHNESKIKTVAAALKDLTYQKLYLIIGLTHQRQPARIFKTILPLTDELIVTRFTTRGHTPLDPSALVKKLGWKKPHRLFLDPFMALTDTLKRATPTDLIVITGSLYLTGEIRTYWRPEHTIITQRYS